ncbi:MAG: SRPBCC family protein [Gammaproteobacteria bacterium]|nr:SRPBCC family protein [Gammaproteobacteria bacterium]
MAGIYKKIGFFLVASLISLILIGLSLDSDFRASQSININAKATDIHPYVDDLKKWRHWSPWQTGQQKIRISYGNVTQGVGATQKWKDGDEYGRLVITASSPQNGIAYDVYFGADTVPSISAIQYKTIKPGVTKVTWNIQGEIAIPIVGPYMAKLVAYQASNAFIEGLSNLRSLVEKNKD